MTWSGRSSPSTSTSRWTWGSCRTTSTSMLFFLQILRRKLNQPKDIWILYFQGKWTWRQQHYFLTFKVARQSINRFCVEGNIRKKTIFDANGGKIKGKGSLFFSKILGRGSKMLWKLPKIFVFFLNFSWGGPVIYFRPHTPFVPLWRRIWNLLVEKKTKKLKLILARTKGIFDLSFDNGTIIILFLFLFFLPFLSFRFGQP